MSHSHTVLQNVSQVEDTILLALSHHTTKPASMNPASMSALLLGHLLAGEQFGRMADKGLLNSPFFGVLADVSEDKLNLPSRIAEVCESLRDAGLVATTDGYYKALYLTAEGLRAVVALHEANRQ